MVEAGEEELSPALQGALFALKEHPSVRAIQTDALGDDGSLRVRAEFEVNLPSRWAVAGQSDNGVRALEEVVVLLPGEFPSEAPLFSLRADFPTDLPHIYPHKRGAPVPPCITFGDRRDVLHGEGMYRLVDQMSDWLDKAAVDQLTNNDQGWEPSRREVGFNFLQIDTDELSTGKLPFGGWRLYLCSGFWNNEAKVSFAEAPTIVRAPMRELWLPRLLKDQQGKGQTRWGEVPVVFCWPTATNDGKPRVDGQYKADTVTTFAELAERASAWGCRVALEDFISNLNPVFENRKLGGSLPLYFVFPIRRPIHLIGSESEYETVAYRTQLDIPGRLSMSDTFPVSPIAFVSPISPRLLRRTSGLAAKSQELSWTFAGCGSLGSKLVMHLARAGVRPGLLIDSKRPIAHNAARHVLLPTHVATFHGKARALADIVETFGQTRPQVYEQDLRDLRTDIGRYRDSFTGERSVVVNTTGSPAVRDYLTKLDFSARLMEGALVNVGAGAFLTLEGPERNPSSADLVYRCYERMREAGLLRNAPGAEGSVLEIGVGCHSVTMPMSDARISLVAAGIGQKLLEFDQTGLPDTGLAATALVDDDGMSIRWNVEPVGVTHQVRVFDEGGWVVRVLDSAHRQIIEDIARYPGVETGGLIVGNISALTREVFVTGVLPAPADSQRSAVRFVLGTEGRANLIAAYQETGHRTLWCLGTWHNHLQPSGPSQMDRNTAAMLDGQLRHAAVLLIRHPEGYAALVRDGIAN